MPENFARLLKRHRIAAGLSQEALASLSGLSPDAISMLERGARRAPYQATLDLLSDALALDNNTRLELEEIARIARARRSRKRKDPTPAAESLPNNLPSQVTSFVGRESDVAEIMQLVRSHRLVTLTGTGGVGKTRCAAQVALQIDDNFADGIWLVELASINNPSLVGSIIAQTLGLQTSRNRTILEELIAYLKRKHLLLVLDNCEHVIEEARTVLDAMLHDCPRVSILATSRERFRIRGEHAFRVSPLAVPSESEEVLADQVRRFGAVQLFIDRALAADNGFRLSDANASDVAEICRRLDGLPLAIELAAAWIPVLSPKQLAQKLHERFRLLTFSDPDSLNRQRTMRTLIDWSYDLLSDQQRRVFRKLSVFPGDFTVDSASAVCIDETLDEISVLEILGSLVDKSLVHVNRQSELNRYRLLETTREYARERIAGTSEFDVAAKAHARSFLTVAEELGRNRDTMNERTWLAQAAIDLDNFRAALTWTLEMEGDVLLGQQLAGSLRAVWAFLGEAEGRQWVKLAREFVNSETPATVVAALDLAESWLATTLSQYKASSAAAERALSRYRELGDQTGAADAQVLLGAAFVKLGRINDGEILLTQSLAEARKVGAWRRSGFALQGLAFARRMAADPSSERLLKAEALALYRENGAERAAADVGLSSAELEFRHGDAATALDLAMEVLRTYREFRLTRHVALVLCNITSYLSTLERYDEALASAREALSTALDSHYDVAVAFALQRLAAIATLRPNADAKERYDDRLRAACLLGYVDARLHSLEVEREYSEEQERSKMLAELHDALGRLHVASLMAEGSRWREDQAAAEAMLT